MKNKKLFSIIIICTAFSLQACALPFNTFNLNEDNTPLADSVIEEDSYTDNQRAIINLLNKRAASDLSYEEYITLSSLYQNEGYFLDARNTLEEAYKLFMDASLLEKLSTITVNIEEENPEIQNTANKLLSLMDTKDFSEVLKITENESFQKTLMDDIVVGKRYFYLSENAIPSLYIEVGFDENNLFSSLIYSFSNDCSVMTEKNNALILENDNNNFISTSIRFSTDTVERKIGSLENGLLNGNYKEEIYTFDDYNNTLSNIYGNLDSLEKKVFESSFENGKVSLTSDNTESLNANNDSEEYSFIPYALLTENNKKFFRVKKILKDEKESFLFDSSFIGKVNPPSINPYMIKQSFIVENAPDNLSDIESLVRIRDGNLQIFNGNTWQSVGSVEEYESKDPFKPYSDFASALEDKESDLNESASAFSNGTETVSVSEKNNTSNNTNTNTNTGRPNTNPTTQAPSQQITSPTPSTPTVSAPVSSPDPQPSSPVVTPPSSDEGSDSGNESSDDNSGSSGSEAGDSGNSNDDSGDDVDVPWSEDLL